MLPGAKNNSTLPPTATPNKRVLRPSSLSRDCRMPLPHTWDRNLPSWQAVVLPCWSTGPPAQNTTCVFRKGDGRITFTVMLPLEGFTFPHLPGAFSLQISLCLCPHALSTCSSSSTSALTRKTRLVVLQVKWKGSQEESGTSSHSSKAAKIVYRNCTGSRTKQGNKSAPGLQLLLHKL